MCKKSSRHIFFAQALLLSLLVFMSACRGKTAEDPQDPSDAQSVTDNEMVIFETDSTEWHVRVFAKSQLYSKAMEIPLPSPWILPTREDAAILKTLSYGDGSERFVTSDGYTFGMPSASVTKAGQKTEYSVLGLWKRQTVIVIEF